MPIGGDRQRRAAGPAAVERVLVRARALRDAVHCQSRVSGRKKLVDRGAQDRVVQGRAAASPWSGSMARATSLRHMPPVTFGTVSTLLHPALSHQYSLTFCLRY